jgi:hypothetical protein
VSIAVPLSNMTKSSGHDVLAQRQEATEHTGRA